MTIPNKSAFLLVAGLGAIFIFAACQPATQNANTTATTQATPPGAQNLSLVQRPQKIADLMKARGEQDQAAPSIKIVSPAP